MNKVLLIGRLTRDPETRYKDENLIFARYTLAVSRRFKKNDDDVSADFINCVTFGKGAEFADKYLKKGMKIAVEGRIQTGNYVNKNGEKVYTTDVIVENHEFAESNRQNGNDNTSDAADILDDSTEDTDGLPFR